MKYDITHALSSLYPGLGWSVSGDSYEGLSWPSQDNKPTEEELIEEVERLQAEYELVKYKEDRAKEYPDFKDYLDGIVKGDQNQIDTYIAACQAVKDKYPKPA
jgi:hypothetical protein